MPYVPLHPSLATAHNRLLVAPRHQSAVILTVLHAARVVAIFQGLLADVLVAMQLREGSR